MIAFPDLGSRRKTSVGHDSTHVPQPMQPFIEFIDIFECFIKCCVPFLQMKVAFIKQIYSITWGLKNVINKWGDFVNEGLG